MQKEITVKEIEHTLNECGEVIEPIIVKRQSDNDVVIISIEEYRSKLLESDIIKHLQKSEEEIENGETIPAEKVFEELRERYSY